MHSNGRRTITRNREMLACIECRRRKLKCDRRSPCGTCSKSGNGTACQYQKFSNGAGDRDRRIEAESRLEHLEHLVQQLAGQADKASSDCQYSSSNGSGAAPSDQGSGLSSATPAHDGPSYHGSTHWSAMLDDIDMLRSAIIPAEADLLENSEEHGSTDVLLCGTPTLRYETVLAQWLPIRQEVDRFVAAYFRSKAIRAPCIHSEQFARQYKAFWDSPTTTSPLWTSILFSICHVASNVFVKDDSRRSNHYSVAAAHCLLAGRYSKPGRFAPESLLLFLQAECLTCSEITADTSLLFGMLMRLLTRMGYHRDPDSFNLTPFEAEMRRRTWSLALQLDLLVSFQLGLPSNVQYPTWDTRPPTSLLDSDFDEGIKELPPARPDTVATDILFYITKHKLMAVFEKVLRHALSPAMDSDPDELDAEIRETCSRIPQILRPRPMAQSVVDAPYLTVTRLCVHFIYVKSLCVLHRPHALKGRAHSINVCHEASSDLLLYFCDAYVELQPGGQNEAERWFLSSFTWHDFLLACTVLCLAICMNSQLDGNAVIDHCQTFDHLKKAQAICADQKARGKDTKRVKKILEATLVRFGQPAVAYEYANPTSTPNDDMGGLIDFNHQLRGDTAPYPSSTREQFRLLQRESTNEEVDWNGAPDLDDPSWSYLNQYLGISSDPLVELLYHDPHPLG